MTTVDIAGEGLPRRLTHNRAGKLKALTRAIHTEPRAGLVAANADAPCFATGAGRAVSTGQQRSSAGPNPAFEAENRQKGYNLLIGPLATREKLVIATGNGIAAGANIARQGIRPAPKAP